MSPSPFNSPFVQRPPLPSPAPRQQQQVADLQGLPSAHTPGAEPGFFAPSAPGPRLVLVLALLQLLSLSSAQLIDPRTTLSCHVRSYQFRVSKPPVVDLHGHVLTCSGKVTVNSCWGRCDSSEIGDYLIPYRISHHPVCTYTGQVSRRVTLPGCGNYPDPSVDVFDAVGCECRLCDSDYTSCENLNG